MMPVPVAAAAAKAAAGAGRAVRPASALSPKSSVANPLTTKQRLPPPRLPPRRSVPAPTNAQEGHTFWRAFDRITQAGFGLQSWIGMFENNMPSYITTTECTVVGKKGTPSKNVLHVALAATFGAMHRDGARYGDVGVEIHVDHTNNIVNVGYTLRTGIADDILQRLANSEIIQKGVNLVASPARRRALGMLAATFLPTTPWISILGIVPDDIGQVQLPAGEGAATIPAGRANEQGVNGNTGLGGGQQATPEEANALANRTNANTLIDKILEGIGYATLGFDKALWSDPKTPLETHRQGSVAKEAVIGAPPPLILRPLKGDYPQPFKSLISPYPETILTRLPYVAKADIPLVAGARVMLGFPAENPVPPTPAKQDWQGRPVMDFNKQVPQDPNTDISDAGAFDLRSLVSQALIEPTILPPAPETDQSFPVLPRR